VDDIGGFEVVSSNGIRRRISDLGTVRMTTDEVRKLAWLDGKPCIVLDIVKKSEGNTVETVKLCRSRMDELNRSMPGGMRLEWISDDGGTVEATVSSTLSDIFSGILLCAAILIFFLGNLRTTLIICISMPLTIIISFFFMYLMGMTLNLATLLATGLSIGILVSNSIVVLENVVRRMEETENRWEAARLGTNEVAVSVLASAGTNVVVMLPIAMMTSIVGLIFVPFAVTTLIVNLASIFISFTLTPILCACLLRPGSSGTTGLWSRFIGWWLGRITALGRRYTALLGALAARRVLSWLIVLGSVALLIHALSFADTIGFNFMEEADRGRIMVKLEYPVNYDLDQTAERVQAVAQSLGQLPDLVNMLVTVGKVDSFGGKGLEAVYASQIQLRFKEKTERDWSIFDKIGEIRKMLEKETGAFITVAVQSEMGGISAPLTINISGAELETLDNLAREIRSIAMHTAGTASVDSTVREGKPQFLITPKRTVLADMGMNSGTLGVLLRGNLEGITAATYKAGDRSYDIRVKYAEIPGREQLRSFMIPGPDGQPVRLEAVAEVTERPIPV
ncbi:MAG: efflux RND transporter permease subunit, partial [Victivallales bacterium]|nr:efflux RND transporter permease subunit [Victivallales bacterium]